MKICPCCESPQVSLYCRVSGGRIEQGRQFDYLQCRICGSVFLSPETLPESDLYTKEYFSTGAGNTFHQWAEGCWCGFLQRLKFRRTPKFPQNAKILDVGFGDGGWMEFLRERDFEVHGLDPSKEACAAARRRGLVNISSGTLENHPFPLAGFDAITANHCLEHCDSPARFIRHAAILLKPGGWLGIVIPNISSWEARRARGQWYHLDPPYHLCLPMPQILKEIMETAGLCEIQSRCPVFDCCQSLFYSALKKSGSPLFLVPPMLPLLVPINMVLSCCQRAGVIEFWGRRPPVHEKAIG